MSATGWLLCLGTLLYSGRQFPPVETMLRDEQRVARFRRRVVQGPHVVQ